MPNTTLTHTGFTEFIDLFMPVPSLGISKSTNKKHTSNSNWRIDWNGMYAWCSVALAVRFLVLYSFQCVEFVFVFTGYTFSAPQFSHLQSYIHNTVSLSVSTTSTMCSRFRNFGLFEINSIQQSVLCYFGFFFWLYLPCFVSHYKF